MPFSNYNIYWLWQNHYVERFVVSQVREKKAWSIITTGWWVEHSTFLQVSSLKIFAQFTTTIWNSFLPLPSAAKLLMCHQVILQHESLKPRNLQIHLEVVWEQLSDLKICMQQRNLEHLCSPTNKTKNLMFPKDNCLRLWSSTYILLLRL